MPSTNEILKDILGTKSFADEDWLKLLDKRFNRIKSHLKSMSLTLLGDVECLRYQTIYYHIIRLTYGEPEPMVECYGDLDVHLHTPGIFGFPRRNIHSHIAPVWGLTREGRWIFVNIELGTKTIGDELYEIAHRLEIREMTPSELSKKTQVPLRRIWETLGEQALHWDDRRHLLAEQSGMVATEIKTDNAIIEALQPSR